ncbi:DNA topoisomerase [Halobacillus shinanisalinarum]|uniref:DNA topoisomerase n=1 Tax=Halobacillus shinanisalinarum TaxID=2932258 RepID=UPI0021072CAA|nr:DNA topoisomerase [Halobacillus shinanisalinarum]
MYHFKSEPFYELYANIKVENGTFQAKYKDRFGRKGDLTNFMNKQGLKSEENTTITKLTKESKKTKSPKLHSLSTLQTKANKKWKYSPTDVLKIMQTLYEKKLLTYPRTDSNHITESEFKYLKNNFSAYQNIADVSVDMSFLGPQKRYVESSKVQELSII